MALLSDQTDWLDELNQQDPFFQHFDHIFNSFSLKKSKRDASLFEDVAGRLGVKPREILFVDDTLRTWKGRRLRDGKPFVLRMWMTSERQ